MAVPLKGTWTPGASSGGSWSRPTLVVRPAAVIITLMSPDARPAVYCTSAMPEPSVVPLVGSFPSPRRTVISKGTSATGYPNSSRARMVMAVLDRPSGGRRSRVGSTTSCRTGFVEPGALTVARSSAGPRPVRLKRTV